MRALKIAWAAMAAALLVTSTGAWGAPTAAANPVHKPGAVGHSVDVDKHLDHVCAGRQLLYQAHVDALYATHNESGQLDIQVVNGQHVQPLDTVCLRLAPDADAQGTPLSQVKIPQPAPGKPNYLDFLGKPGEVVWTAPQIMPFLQGNRPIWAGTGAFDSAHEWAVPEKYGKSLTFELVDYRIPRGASMHAFATAASTPEPERLFSIPHGPQEFKVSVGSHGHNSWAFTQPGVYSTTWKVTGQLSDGTRVHSAPRELIWLVGTDEEVGLPAGTTLGLNPVTHPLVSDVLPEPPTAPSEAATPGESAQLPAGLAQIHSGHMDLALGADQRGEISAYLKATHNKEVVRYESGDFVFVVGQHAQVNVGTAIPGMPEKPWVLPQTQAENPNVPWVGFSAEDGADMLGKGPIKLRIADFSGPGRMITGHSGITGFSTALDSADLNRSVDYAPGAHDHQAFFFSAPGAYAVTLEYSGTDARGQRYSVPLRAYFQVEGRPGDADAGAGTGEADPSGSSGSSGSSSSSGISDSAQGSHKRVEPTEIRGMVTDLTTMLRGADRLATTVLQDTARPSREIAQVGPPEHSGALQSGPHSGSTAAGGPAGAVPAATPASTPAVSGSPGNRASSAPVAAPAPTSAPAAAPAGGAADDEAAQADLGAPASTEQAAPGDVAPSDGSMRRIEAHPTPTGITAGGWWAGLAVGMGIMGLIGGLVMWLSARSLLKHAGAARPTQGAGTVGAGK